MGSWDCISYSGAVRICRGDFAVNTLIYSDKLVVDPSRVLDRVNTVLLTHGHVDHFRYAGPLREKGATIYAPRYCVPLVEEPKINYMATMGWTAGFDERYITPYFVGNGVRVDVLVEPGNIEVGGTLVKAIAAPGHTPGHTVYLVEASGTIFLVAGDAIYGEEYLEGNPILYHTDTISWLETLNRLEKFDYDVLVPGHGFPVEAKEARRVIRRNREKIHEMLSLVESVLQEEPLSADEVIELLLVATGLARSRRAYSIYMPSVRALLNALTSLGRAQREVVNGVPKWAKSIAVHR
ncbi:Zn-dependent hydrolase [Pyrodictium delaneyi]|nr:MBL fold metallo-hydrolase [Pyrodictium delaneyi]ALL00453.1 Zn-dependent hydrolase [Pyrodictium delaneyi]